MEAFAKYETRYYINVIIALIASMTIKLQPTSNNHKFLFLPIQITSIDVDVTRNPSQTKTPHMIPVPSVAPCVKGEKDYCIQDCKILYNCFTEMMYLMLKQKKLIARDSYGRTGFVAYKLADVAKYLDEWKIGVINSFSRENLFALFKKLPLSVTVTDQIFKLHLESNPNIVQKYFEKYGSVYISNHESYYRLLK